MQVCQRGQRKSSPSELRSTTTSSTPITIASSISQFTQNIFLNGEEVNGGLSCYSNSLAFLFCNKFAEVASPEHVNFVLAKGFEGYKLLCPRQNEMLRVSDMETKLRLLLVRYQQKNYRVNSSKRHSACFRQNSTYLRLGVLRNFMIQL